MPKIKLKQKEKYEFVYKTKVNVRDVNYGGHLGNDSLVGLTHEARIDLLDKMGFTELDLGDGKTGLIMTDLAVNFIGEGFLLDEIEILSHIDEITAASFRVFHKISKSNKVLALVETGLVTFNYNEKSIEEIPQQFLDKLDKYM